MNKQILILFLLIHCSLYDDYTPKNGEFCNLEKDCFEIDIQNYKLKKDSKEFPLLSLNRAKYETIINNKTYKLDFKTENKIEFITPENLKTDYFRKKKKR